ncbi:ParB/RepB/Spo0J family partition protein [Emticicia sp. CRIBPO]|uniref:ParB/RepB/Spo0J family partition protein n=1 Tax=Emticicia sp. CRIBPO TaxID=2683258 RepID=UPI001412E18F|nr:ParB/RepB/Spo0J family partition protein [Emticicia sp. CRIBPO]NBA87578.1 ParB/RepB/Spo0J family partition protein [Emticicia sp. CRIBPO]
MDKNKKRIGLGRGLGALLADVPAQTEDSTATESAEIVEAAISNEIPLHEIETNPFQPRTNFDKEALMELSESIRVQGIIQPITVRRLGPNKYQLISGERRLQASKLADLKAIPAYIREADDQQMLEMALIENIQRENLNAIEIALSYQRLMQDCDLKQEELGDRVGKDRSTVNNYMRLLKLPPLIQAGLRDKKISMGHARALLSLENKKDQEKLFYITVTEELSVRKVEEAVRKLNDDSPKSAKPEGLKSVKREISEVQDRLTGWFGKKVSVVADDKHKGEIKIPFISKEDLDDIINLLKSNA